MNQSINTPVADAARLLDAIARALDMLPDPVLAVDRERRAEFSHSCHDAARTVHAASGEPGSLAAGDWNFNDEFLSEALVSIVGVEQARELLHKRDNPTR